MINLITLIVFVICFVALVIGSITDLKTREVPDMLNYGLILLGFGISLLASFIYWDYSYVLSSFLGFVFCFLFASVMFYAGQWGGGDAKMLIAMGSLLGLPLSTLDSLIFIPTSFTVGSISAIPFLLLFLLCIFFSGGVYGGLWLFVLLVKYRQEFSSKYIVFFTDKKHRLSLALLHILSLALVVSSFFTHTLLLQLILFFIGMMMLILCHGFVAIRILEQIAFIKEIPIAKVTEGDWVAENVIVAGKVIVRKKDLGISREQLDELHALAAKKKIKTIPVRYGIPFVPSFLLAFVVCVVLVYIP